MKQGLRHMMERLLARQGEGAAHIAANQEDMNADRNARAAARQDKADAEAKARQDKEDAEAKARQDKADAEAKARQDHFRED
jgi:hypothetical protein